MYNKQFASSRQASNSTKFFSTKSNLLGKLQFDNVPMKIPAHFKRWEETLMNAVHGALDLGFALSNNISTEEKGKRSAQQPRGNEPKYSSQNRPIGQDIESSFYDYFQNDSFDEENPVWKSVGCRLGRSYARTSSGARNFKWWA